MDYPDIIYTKENHIATIRLNRPEKRNAFTPEMSESIYLALKDSADDKEVRVIILTGSGRAFCAGADVKAMSKQLESGGGPRGMAYQGGGHSMYTLIRNCDKPVIAAINGVAAGGGVDLACACDIRIASDQARFAEVFIRRGMMPASGGTYFLPRLVGIDNALLMIWTGDMVDAAEAERIGLVTQVVPHDELDMATMELAEKLAKGPPIAIQRAKRAVYQGLEWNYEETMRNIAPIIDELNHTEDHKEGALAFVEKREPVFRGE